MRKLFAGEKESRNKRCGNHAGLCDALLESLGRNESLWGILDKLFPSNVACRDYKWAEYKNARKIECWIKSDYWAKPLSIWGFAENKKESEEAYTARILLLEWFALEQEELGN